MSDEDPAARLAEIEALLPGFIPTNAGKRVLKEACAIARRFEADNEATKRLWHRACEQSAGFERQAIEQRERAENRHWMRHGRYIPDCGDCEDLRKLRERAEKAEADFATAQIVWAKGTNRLTQERDAALAQRDSWNRLTNIEAAKARKAEADLERLRGE